MLDKPTRNHWTFLVQNILSSFKELIIFMILILTSKNKLYYLIGVLILIVIFSVIRWWKTLFYIKDNMLVFQKGLLSKERQEIPFDKINTVDVGKGLLDRLFNTCTVKIDSGSAIEKNSDFKIKVKYEIAEELRSSILNAKHKDIEDEGLMEDSFEEATEKTITIKELIIYGLTKGKLAWAMGGYFVVANFLDDIEKFTKTSVVKDFFNSINLSGVLSESKSFMILGIVATLIMAYIMITIVSIIFEIIRLYNFSIKAKGENLNISYGLISKKEYSIPIKKVHALRYKQSILQQLLGVYTLEAVTIGYGDEKDEKAILYPIANKKFNEEFLGKLLPEMDFIGDIKKAPKSSLRRFILKRTIIALIVLLPLCFVFKTMPVQLKVMVVSIIVLINIILGYLNYRNTSLGVSEKTIIASSGGLTKTTTLIKQSSVQSIGKSQNPLQRRGKVSDYKIDIYSNNFGEVVKVRHMDESVYADLNQNLIM